MKLDCLGFLSTDYHFCSNVLPYGRLVNVYHDIIFVLRSSGYRFHCTNTFFSFVLAQKLQHQQSLFVFLTLKFIFEKNVIVRIVSNDCRFVCCRVK